MPFIPVTIPPGVNKIDSAYQATGRWIDTQWVRFVGGSPEKIGGVRKLTDTSFSGIARGAAAWVTNDGVQVLAWGTEDDFYVFRADAVSEKTPYRADANGITLTDPFTTTNGSAIVTVADTAHGIATAGVKVTFSGATAVGGITIDGTYTVASVVDVDSFTITHGSNASSGASGGGSVTASYEINFGNANPLYLVGWGVGAWGAGGWGSYSTLVVQNVTEPRWWSVNQWGEDLIINPSNGTLYRYDSSADTRPAPITNAPAIVRASFVTQERYIMALGCTRIDGTFDAMCVRWPDILDTADWTPGEADTANERRLNGGSRLMAGTALTAGINLIWSDSTVFSAIFTGSTYVFDSRLIGTECGLVGPLAFSKTDMMAFWMSPTGFYLYSSYVQPIPNQENIRDWVLEGLNKVHQFKCLSFYVKEYNEAWFLFPTTTDEPDTYVGVNLTTFEWFNGTLTRTSAATYTTAESRPILFSPDGYIFIHEVKENRDNDGAAQEAYISFAEFALEDGNRSLDIFGVVPDFKRHVGNVDFYLYSRDHPEDEIMDEETVTVSVGDKLVDAKLPGRQVGGTITSNVIGGDFRLGKWGLEIQGAGKKR